MKIWLVRHAKPLIDEGVCYGSMDVPADQSANWKAASDIARVLPKGLRVTCSPLQRCDMLARSLEGLRPDLAFKTDPRIREFDFGVWEGVRWSEIPSAAIDRWKDNFGQHPFGGAESLQAMMKRVGLALVDDGQRGEDAIWITHAGVIRAVTLLSKGVFEITKSSVWPREGPGFGQWLSIDIS